MSGLPKRAKPRFIVLSDIATQGSGTDIQDLETCVDGILNQDEENIDCGGTCMSCGKIYYFSRSNE